MPRALFLIFICFLTNSLSAQQRNGQTLNQLRLVYDGWRNAVIQKNATAWKRFTSNVRQITVRNRFLSERRQFPNAVFDLPFQPTDLSSLKILRATVQGRTAKTVYFGKIDFGVGGKPRENLIVISYLQEASGWKYHGAEFINLNALPDIRKQLKEGKLDYIQHADFGANGVVEKTPRAITRPVPIVAKAYVFCPGREVKLLINKTSTHLFQNTKAAETIIGGVNLGENEVQYAIKDLPGGKPTAFTIRVYLFPEKSGAKITDSIKATEYQFKDGTTPNANGSLRFRVTQEMARKLKGR